MKTIFIICSNQQYYILNHFGFNHSHILFSRSLTFVVWINGFGFEEVNIQENVARRTTN